MNARQSQRLAKTPAMLTQHETLVPGKAEQFRALTVFVEAPDSVKAARDMARSAVLDWGLAHLVEDVRLVVADDPGHEAVEGEDHGCLAEVDPEEADADCFPGAYVTGADEEDGDDPEDH